MRVQVLWPVLLLCACGRQGVCEVVCDQSVSTGIIEQRFGPYYDETLDECEEEAERSNEELADFDSVCRAEWTPY